MLLEEAKWLREHVLQLSVSNQRVLNVGSSTRHARTEAQPHMQSDLFDPLAASGFNVTHTDLQPAEGVDLVGDLTDEAFLAKLLRDDYGLVLCTNVLEHVPERAALVNALAKLPSPGGYLVVTVPKHYPYHYDPIDTMFRPGAKTLSAMFPTLQLVEGQVLEARRRQVKGNTVRAQKNYFRMLADNPDSQCSRWQERSCLSTSRVCGGTR